MQTWDEMYHTADPGECIDNDKRSSVSVSCGGSDMMVR
jgi:hypothetical protein